MPPLLHDEPPSKRRPRHRLSCGECRRLKLKCDRVWPCSSCTKRGCARICPDGTLQAKVRSKDTSVLLSKIAELEDTIREKDKAITAVIHSDMTTSDMPSEQHDPIEGNDFLPASSIFASPTWALQSVLQDNSNDAAMTSLLDGIGTLNVGIDGRSRYLGMSAGSAYIDADASDSDSRASTPGTSEVSDVSGYFGFSQVTKFPLSLGSPQGDVTELKRTLPLKHEAARLGNIYYSLVSYMYEPFERQEFAQLLEEAYNDYRDEMCPTRLALLYTVFCLGVLFDPALPPIHPDFKKWQNLAEACLMSTDYLTNPTLASVQTLHLFGTVILNSRTDAGETYWPILGVAMRLAQSMGLHRDGSNWGLEQPDLDNRRRTFHELLSVDRLQALGLGRPYSIGDKHFDTTTPAGSDIIQEAAAQKCSNREGDDDDEVRAAGFHVFKWRFSSTIGMVVDDAFSVVPPSYSVIMKLDADVRNFDQSLPDALRCAAVPNMAPVPINARHDTNFSTRATPNLKLTMQQHTLGVFTNQTLLFLHRRAFVQALTESREPMQTPYASSVVTVILEAGRNLIAIAKSAQEIYELSNRWWHLFFHAYGGAACQAALLIKAPGSMLVQNAWEQLRIAVGVFETAAQHGPLARDLLPRLLKLQEKAMVSVQAYQSGAAPPRFRRPSTTSVAGRGLRPLSRIRANETEEGSTPMASGSAGDPYRSSSSDGDEIPPELGATTRLTRKTRRRQHSISGSSAASRRVASVSSSRSRGASFGTVDSSSASDRGISSYRTSWSGPPQDFEDADGPPPWQNLSIEPRDSFGSPVFGGHPGMSNHYGSYFQGFNDTFHPPMVLPSSTLRRPRSATTGASVGRDTSAFAGYNRPLGPYDSPRLHPLPPSVTGSPPLGPLLGGSALSLSMSRSASTSGNANALDRTDTLHSPSTNQFELLDTFLSWQGYDPPYDSGLTNGGGSDGRSSQ